MDIIPGPYTAADDLLNALDHAVRARSFLKAWKRPQPSAEQQCVEARNCLYASITWLVAALLHEPTSHERARAHGTSLNELLNWAQTVQGK